MDEDGFPGFHRHVLFGCETTAARQFPENRHAAEVRLLAVDAKAKSVLIPFPGSLLLLSVHKAGSREKTAHACEVFSDFLINGEIGPRAELATHHALPSKRAASFAPDADTSPRGRSIAGERNVLVTPKWGKGSPRCRKIFMFEIFCRGRLAFSESFR